MSQKDSMLQLLNKYFKDSQSVTLFDIIKYDKSLFILSNISSAKLNSISLQTILWFPIKIKKDTHQIYTIKYDELHGIFKFFTPTSSSVYTLRNWKNGKQHGHFKTLDFYNKTIKESYYDNGENYGVSKIWTLLEENAPEKNVHYQETYGSSSISVMIKLSEVVLNNKSWFYEYVKNKFKPSENYTPALLLYNVY